MYAGCRYVRNIYNYFSSTFDIKDKVHYLPGSMDSYAFGFFLNLFTFGQAIES